MTLRTWLLLLLAGCGHANYAYHTNQTLKYPDGSERDSVLYWNADDDGQLLANSGLSLIACDTTEKEFVPVGASDVTLILRSQAMDKLVKTVDETGNVVDLATEQHKILHDGEAPCARILIKGVPATMDKLRLGTTPQLAILCEGDQEEGPLRYPTPSTYQYPPIERTLDDGGTWNPTLQCTNQANAQE